MHININTSDTARIWCKCTLSMYMYIWTDIVHFYNICVVSHGLCLNLHLIYSLCLMERRLKCAFNLLVDVMESLFQETSCYCCLPSSIGAKIQQLFLELFIHLLRDPTLHVFFWPHVVLIFSAHPAETGSGKVANGLPGPLYWNSHSKMRMPSPKSGFISPFPLLLTINSGDVIWLGDR